MAWLLLEFPMVAYLLSWFFGYGLAKSYSCANKRADERQKRQLAMQVDSSSPAHPDHRGAVALLVVRKTQASFIQFDSELVRRIAPGVVVVRRTNPSDRLRRRTLHVYRIRLCPAGRA